LCLNSWFCKHFTGLGWHRAWSIEHEARIPIPPIQPG